VFLITSVHKENIHWIEFFCWMKEILGLKCFTEKIQCIASIWQWREWVVVFLISVSREYNMERETRPNVEYFIITFNFQCVIYRGRNLLGGLMVPKNVCLFVKIICPIDTWTWLTMHVKLRKRLHNALNSDEYKICERQTNLTLWDAIPNLTFLYS